MSNEKQSDFIKLSPREQQILHEVVKGLSNPEIASLFNISANTIKITLSNMMRKLGVDSRLKLAVKAVREEMIRRMELDES